VLTPSHGKITVKARGARRKNSPLRASAQLFAWSEMLLFERQGRYTLSEAELLSAFPGLSADLDTLALASYFVDVLGAEPEDAPSHPDVTRLALNALHALSAGAIPRETVKAAFELRYIALSGYQPALEACHLCGGPAETGAFDPNTGLLVCARCGRGPDAIPLDAAALMAARYILSAPVGRIFGARLGAASMAALSHMTESYLLACLERGFKTLGFYHAAHRADARSMRN
jgi:DNA repair protein RecO (recombination protein O)